MKKTLLLIYLKAATSRNPRKNTTRFNGLLALFVMVMGMGVSWGQVLWSSSGGSAWLTGSNWTGSAVPTSTQIAQFGGNPAGILGVGINFNSTTNAGDQWSGSRIQEVGAVEVTSARNGINAMIIGNSTSTLGATGQFRLNGATVNSNSNTIIRNASNQLLTIQNIQNTGNQTMSVILNATNNKIYIDGAGGITISSIITGASQNLEKAGSGTGVLTLTGANTFTGLTTVSAGTLRLNKSGGTTIPITNSVNVSGGTLRVSSNQTLASLTVTGGTVQIDSGVTLTITGNVSIPSGANLILNGVLTSTGTRTLTIASGANVTIGNISGLETATGTFSGGKTFTEGANYTVSVATTTPLGVTISANNFSTTESITLNSALSVSGSLSFGNVNSKTITTSGNLTLKSTSTGTAYISDLTNGGINSGNTISGNVTVERYLPARRAWRLLTAPLKGSSNNSIYANWQGVNDEGVLLWHPNGNGTNGLSVGPQANIWSYSNGWYGNDVSNTNTSLLFSTKNNAYLVYATGPSNSNNIASNTGASITTLRPKGELITGTVNYTGLTADQFHLLGNPYASPIDIARLRTSNSSFTFYLLDPSLGDANSRGGYYTYNGSWTPNTPPNELIQSGQGFFVKSASATTFDVAESHKDSGNSNMWFDRTTADTSVDKIRVLLYKQDNNSWYLADGILAANSATGNNEVDAADADKMTNFNENLLFKNGTSNLAIEYRGLPAAGTLQHIQLTGTTAQAYQMRLKTENYSNSNLTPYLENIQTGVLTAIPTDGSEVIVSFTGIAATSAAPDSRFRIVYQAPLSADDLNSLVVGVYPNPVNEGLFTIELANTNAPASYTLTNLLGQEVQKGTLMALTNAIAVQDLSKGVYLLQINQEGKRFSTKLMIK